MVCKALAKNHRVAGSLIYQFRVFEFGYQSELHRKWTPNQVVQEILIKGLLADMGVKAITKGHWAPGDSFQCEIFTILGPGGARGGISSPGNQGEEEL